MTSFVEFRMQLTIRGKVERTYSDLLTFPRNYGRFLRVWEDKARRRGLPSANVYRADNQKAQPSIRLGFFGSFRAGDGIRTHDTLLGKQMRYHCATPACVLYYNHIAPKSQVRVQLAIANQGNRCDAPVAKCIAPGDLSGTESRRLTES